MTNLTELKKAAEVAKKQSDWYEYQLSYGMEVINIEDQKFIALANPATILKLIAVVKAAEDTPAKFQTTEMKAALKEFES